MDRTNLNPNDYDDDAYSNAMMQSDPIGLWRAGAEPDDIASQLSDWLSDESGLQITVRIDVA